MSDLASQDRRSTRHEERRREVLQRAADYVFRNGLSDLSIRPMAEAIGVSHATLLHHFGSKEELIARVLMEIREQQIAEISQWPEAHGTDVLAFLDQAWARFTSVERLPFMRVYFEVYAVALQKPDLYGQFFEGLIENWLRLFCKPLLALGADESEARAAATLIMGWVRGLIIDLLTSGDRKRVNAAYALARDALKVHLDSLRRTAVA